MTFNEYQQLARRTQNVRLNDTQRMIHAITGLQSEVGEVSSIVQHIYQGKDASRSEFVFEIGDVFWFLGELCDVLGIDMDYVAKMNIDKLARRYPDGFSETRSEHRHEFDDSERGGEDAGY